MHRSYLLALTLLQLCTQYIQVQSVEWHIVYFVLPSSSHGYTELSGEMVVPPLPHAGTYYLWPGLQPTDNTGVFQDVLDGRFGNPWHFAPGWYSTNYSEPWGASLNATAGDTVSFNMTYQGPSWSGEVADAASGVSKPSTFPLLGGKDFNQAVFAIELYDETWDFGPVTYKNIVLSALGTDTSWCSTTPTSSDNTTYAISGVQSSVTNGVVTCNIAELVMEGPAK